MQSGRPAASGGFVVEVVVEVEPVPVELVLLLPLIGLVVVVVLLPVLGLGVSLRTCFVTASQHFPELEAALGDVVVEEVWATANPMLPASIAAAIKPIPVIRMRRILLVRKSPANARRDCVKTGGAGSRSFLLRDKKRGRKRDAAAGLKTACFISGYRGSPLGGFDRALWQARRFIEKNHIRHQPGSAPSDTALNAGGVPAVGRTGVPGAIF